MPKLTESVIALLSRGAATRADLQGELHVSQPTLSRAIAELGNQIVRIGRGRSTRYGLRRELPLIGSFLPIFRVDREGEARLIGRMHALAREQYWFDAPGTDHGLFDGLPFFLQDLWPQGFIGRTIPGRFPELGLPERVTDWSDTHVLGYLCRRGEDCIGDFIVGDESLQRYLKQSLAPAAPIGQSARGAQYAQLADAAIAGAPAGSSAGGEHPKFTTLIGQGEEQRNVLVKFSPAGSDPQAQRWRDLLVCEHLAADAMRQAGLPSNTTDLIESGGRMFLEVTRFDRTGARGRVGVLSLAAIADHHLGRRDSWVGAANALRAIDRLSSADHQSIRRLATFGQLIGNTDMHFGNLSFFFSFGARLALAPAYDMLPMLYAPVAGDAGLPTRLFEPPLPTADNLDVWRSVAEVAQEFWRLVSEHELVSTEFAAQARRNAGHVAQIKTVAP